MWQARATPAYVHSKRPHAFGLAVITVLLGSLPARPQVTTNVADFVDRATAAGLSFSNVFGPKDAKTNNPERISCRQGTHESSLPQQPRRHLLGRDASSRAGCQRLGTGRLCRRF